jgi:hypothetical protein
VSCRGRQATHRAMRRGGLRRTSPSCRSCCGSRNQISGIDSSARPRCAILHARGQRSGDDHAQSHFGYRNRDCIRSFISIGASAQNCGDGIALQGGHHYGSQSGQRSTGILTGQHWANGPAKARRQHWADSPAEAHSRQHTQIVLISCDEARRIATAGRWRVARFPPQRVQRAPARSLSLEAPPVIEAEIPPCSLSASSAVCAKADCSKSPRMVYFDQF